VPGFQPESSERLQLLPNESIEIDLGGDDQLLSTIQPMVYGTPPINPKTGPYAPFQRWTMQGKYDQWPRFIHGKLFFTLSGTNYVCSATVIGRSVVATAGHCVSSGSGVWATNMSFCPGYNQAGPMSGVGCWGVRGRATTGRWHFNSDTDYDFACLITNLTGTERNSEIGVVTGGAGYAFNFPSSQPTVAFGYPAGTPFGGKTIQQVVSAEWYEADMVSGGQKSKYIGSDMTGGSSGGGWFLSWRHPSAEYPDTDASSLTDPAGANNGPFLSGVNSHKRCRTNCGTPPTDTAGLFWQEMGSPQFLRSDADSQDVTDIFSICFDNQ
jgi:hypothetical protein